MTASKSTLAFLPLLLLAACDGTSVRETIGISRKAPDEFRVVSRPPLSVPPEFNLRPPAAPGEVDENSLEQPAYRQAESLLRGEEPGAVALRSGSADTAVQAVSSAPLSKPSGTQADSLFLDKAGATNAEANIRETLQREAAEASPEEKTLLQKLRSDGPNEPVVDARQESERLQENKAGGKPVTEGETPMNKPKDTGPLGRWLGW